MPWHGEFQTNEAADQTVWKSLFMVGLLQVVELILFNKPQSVFYLYLKYY